MKNPKKILIVNTGGTISSIKTENGLEPTKNYVEAALSMLMVFKHPDLPDYHFVECDPVIDSSNMSSDYWNQIVDQIVSHAETMDGFIVFHGTDTMAYTASALSFMLQNFAKPIILTGSQLPLTHARSDAIENVITSLLLCCEENLNEVCIYFNQTLLRGNRTRKIHTHQFDAFSSPNYPPLATVGIDVQLNSQHWLPKATGPFQIQHITPQPITTFRLFPGCCFRTLAALLQLPLRALILETYGTGNAPNNQPELFSLLNEATKRGILIMNSTQCLTGRVEMSHYATGVTLEKVGVMSAGDMTPEALHSKLLYACSRTDDPSELRRLMQQTFCGEKSVD